MAPLLEHTQPAKTGLAATEQKTAVMKPCRKIAGQGILCLPNYHEERENEEGISGQSGSQSFTSLEPIPRLSQKMTTVN